MRSDVLPTPDAIMADYALVREYTRDALTCVSPDLVGKGYADHVNVSARNKLGWYTYQWDSFDKLPKRMRDFLNFDSVDVGTDFSRLQNEWSTVERKAKEAIGRIAQYEDALGRVDALPDWLKDATTEEVELIRTLKAKRIEEIKRAEEWKRQQERRRERIVDEIMDMVDHLADRYDCEFADYHDYSSRSIRERFAASRRMEEMERAMRRSGRRSPHYDRNQLRLGFVRILQSAPLDDPYMLGAVMRAVERMSPVDLERIAMGDYNNFMYRVQMVEYSEHRRHYDTPTITVPAAAIIPLPELRGRNF
jgi:hypothetical protein